MLPIDHFFRRADLTPDAIAVIDGDRHVTFAELARQANALAAALQSIDPQAQSRVGVCGYNTYQHLLGWMAVYASGKVWIPFNPRNGADELKRIAEMVQPSIIIVDADCLDKVTAGEARLLVGKPEGKKTGDLTHIESLIDQFDGQQPERPNLTPDDLQGIKFTGGSSGTPKGCMQTYRVVNTCVTSMIVEFEFNAEDRNLLAAPMTHGTNTLILPTMARGGVQVFMGPSKPASIIDAIEKDRITTVFMPPTVIYMMMAEAGVETRDFSSLKHLIVGGASIRAAEVPRAMALFNNSLETCFGQTEAPQIVTCMRAEDWLDERNWASTGRATVMTDIGIMGPEGSFQNNGESGEVVIRGDLVMKGYLDQPKITAETIIDGWLHTGDVGVIDERGFLFIKDRIRDVIITGGFNVYPSDVEAVLGSHPAVQECVVFGTLDDKWGEAVQAAVELHDGSTAEEAEIIDFIKQKMDSVKAPKRVHFTDALPRSGVGKVLRREAKVKYAALSEKA